MLCLASYDVNSSEFRNNFYLTHLSLALCFTASRKAVSFLLFSVSRLNISMFLLLSKTILSAWFHQCLLCPLSYKVDNCQHIYKKNIYKALANKIAILEFAIQTPQHLTYLRWTFATEYFSALYHPHDTRDEKVSLALAHWKHGKRDRIPTELRRITDGFFVWVLSWWHSVAILSQCCRDSINSTDFQCSQRIFDGTRVFISPCSKCARAELSSS